VINSKLKSEEDQIIKQPILFKQINTINLLTLNQPQTLNTMNVEILESLLTFQNKIKKNHNIQIIILQTCGKKTFYINTNLKNHTKNYDSKSTKNQLGFLIHKIFQNFEQLKTPIITIIQKYTLKKKLELALTYNLRITSDTTKFNFPKSKINNIPNTNNTQHLTHLINTK